MEKQNDVVFRRVRGRIVPIKRKKQDSANNSNKIIGASTVALGLAVPSIAGRLETKSRQAVGKFTTASEKNFYAADRIGKNWVKRAYKRGEQMDMFDNAKRFRANDRAFKYARTGDRFRRAANVLKKINPKLRTTSLFLGGALIGQGLNQVIANKNDSQTTEFTKKVGADIAGITFLAGAGNFNIRGKLKAGFKVFRKVIRK